MTEHCESSLMSSMINVNTTYFFEDETPKIVKKQLSPYIVIDTLRNSIMGQFEYTFGEKPESSNLEMLVEGFVLFNLHKNKYMLTSKEALLNYVKDKSISIEEIHYFLDIFLYNQRPKFLTIAEHEHLTACGDLKDFDDCNYQRESR